MNVKELALKSIAPATAGAIVLASGALSALAGFVITSSVPSNCTSSYGYSATAGYGYGYDTSSCTTTTLGGGGGGSVYVSTPVDTSTSTNTDTIWDETDTTTDTTWIVDSIDGQTCDASSAEFNDESRAGYLFACENNITTKRDIDDSIFYGILIRKEMAKMISNYAMNVLGMEPDTTKSCDFSDISDESAEMQSYIKTACQLGLMGYQADGQTKAPVFNPNQSVSRAMFGTLFSRMLYGDQYNANIGDVDYYSAHLAALKDANLLKNISPNMTEIRGYVWIVFDRASSN